MRIRILFCFLMFVIFDVFAQEELYNSYTDYRKTFLVEVEYENFEDCEIEIWETLDECRRTPIKKGMHFNNKFDREFSGFYSLGVDTGGGISSDYLKIVGSEQLPDYALYKNSKGNDNPRWIPIWYFEALEKEDRDIIVLNEPKRTEWDADAVVSQWYYDIPQLLSIVLSNCGFMVHSPLLVQNTGFLISKINDAGNGKYEIAAYPSTTDSDDQNEWKTGSENFPHLTSGEPVSFIFEINGKEMKIYNGETGKLCLDLIQMPAKWVALYEDFIRTNTIPAGLYLSEEYLKRKNGGSIGDNVHVMEDVAETAVPKPASAIGKIAAVTENLRLRTDDKTTAQVVTTLAAGAHVKVLAHGREDTIDDIASNWTQVEVLGGAQDKDGNSIEAGTVGWLFGGYLSEAESAENERANKETSTAKEPSALPIVPIVVGVAALAVLLAVVILTITKKRKSDNR